MDIYSPFRWHLKKARERAKKKNILFSLTLKDLRNQWIKQKGLCVYSGRKLINPASCNLRCGTRPINLATVDRIDSSKGYIPENIQFICLIAQNAKNSYSSEDLIEFCKCVYEYQVRTNNKILI